MSGQLIIFRILAKNKRMIKNIVFDLGGVLIDWNPRYYFKNYFQKEEEMEYFLREVCDTKWNSTIDAGKPFEQAIKERQKIYPEYAEALSHYGKHWADMLGSAFESSVNLLKEVKNRGYRVLALTNWSAETFPIALAKYDFLQLFEGIVVSGEVKTIKPDVKIFKILIDKYSINAEESVFIDDNKENVEAAASLGFNAIRFDNIDNVRSQLRSYVKD